jgi:hypothetical protein
MSLTHPALCPVRDASFFEKVVAEIEHGLVRGQI